MKRVLLAIMLLWASFEPGIQAAIVFDNGLIPSNVENGGASDFAPPKPPNTFIFERADDFIISAGSTTITQVKWLGVYTDFGTDVGVPANDDFTVRIFAANGQNSSTQLGDGLPLPGDILATFTPGNSVNRQSTATILPTLNLRVYSYEVSLGTLTLAPGRYWLSVINNTASDTDDTWYWAILGQPGNGTSRFTNPENPPITDWSVFGSSQMAFQLTDNAATVPVPSAVQLFLSGIAVLSMLWKRTRWTACLFRVPGRC